MSESSYAQQLEKDGKLIYTNSGCSMLPLLRPHRDLMIIEKKPDTRCKKYDVILYKRPTGVYVIHRIMKVRKDDYVLCGDHCLDLEPGVREDWILGVLKAVVRDGKEIPVTDFRYRCYVHLWCDFFWIRALILRLMGSCNRRFKKHEKT